MNIQARVFLLGILAAACTSRVDGPPPPSARGFSRPIFRAINLAPYDSIRLGAPVPPSVPVMRLSDTLLQLQPGSFGGTQGIAVNTSLAGQVTSLTFDYAPGTSFEGMVTEYADLLGPPAAAGMLGPAGPQWRYWDDGSTRFEITRQADETGEKVQSRLIDITAVEP